MIAVVVIPITAEVIAQSINVELVDISTRAALVWTVEVVVVRMVEVMVCCGGIAWCAAIRDVT